MLRKDLEPRARLGLGIASVVLLLLAPACGSDPGERRRSIYALKADPTAANIVAIREGLSDADRDVRATALNALVELRVEDTEIAGNRSFRFLTGGMRSSGSSA